MKAVITGITKQLRTVTPKVYLNYVPADQLLKSETVVYTISNPEKHSVGENTEALNFYEVSVRVNSMQITQANSINEVDNVLNLIAPLKNALRKLEVQYIKCLSEDFIYDDTNNIHTYTLNYQIQN